MAKIDLSEAYKRVFPFNGGVRIMPPPVDFVFPPINFGKPLDIVKSIGEDATGNFTKTRSTLGTPFFMPCKIDGFQLPNEPIVTLRSTKTIIETPIDGTDGTFKECYANGDYQITIKGICALDEESDEYPDEQIRAIRKFWDKRTGVDVVCRLLSIYNINHIAIKSIDWPAIEGAPGMQPYQIECLSDKYFDLELLEGND
jgi:hypothetical protein